MFTFFSKKPQTQINEEAAKEFWAWFGQQEDWIKDCIAKQDSAFIWAIDERLKPVFPYFQKELEFQLGYNDDVGEFFFYHFGKKQLAHDGKILGSMMPPAIAKNWQFILQK